MNLFADAYADLPGYPAVWSPEPVPLYRYCLWRVFTTSPPKRIFSLIGLNPSTADEMADDPTVYRVQKRARALGFDALCMLNAFSLRSTDPMVMKRATVPVGDHNDEWLVRCASISAIVVAAWGVHGEYQGRGEAVRRLIPNLMCLGVTKDNYPRHPLYLKDSTPLIPYDHIVVDGKK
jgi:hypothetical protein